MIHPESTKIAARGLLRCLARDYIENGTFDCEETAYEFARNQFERGGLLQKLT